MSRTRAVEIAVALIAGLALVVALGVAITREPARIDAADDDILTTQIDDAMDLYAEQCSVCHGLNGEGIGSNPPLDSEALRTADVDSLFKTIERGRFGTAMPAWSLRRRDQAENHG